MLTIDQTIPKAFDLKCFKAWADAAVKNGWNENEAIDLVFDYQVALCNDDFKTKGDLIEKMQNIADEFEV